MMITYEYFIILSILMVTNIQCLKDEQRSLKNMLNPQPSDDIDLIKDFDSEVTLHSSYLSEGNKNDLIVLIAKPFKHASSTTSSTSVLATPLIIQTSSSKPNKNMETSLMENNLLTSNSKQNDIFQGRNNGGSNANTTNTTAVSEIKQNIIDVGRSPSRIIKATCGYPGSPRNGRVLHLLERYEEGMVVTYECDPGFYLLGPMTRTCLSNSTWSNRMPICDQSMKNLGLTSASEALNNYPPQLAVDGNFRTCFFSNRRKPRWWRVELPKSLKNQSIISVALTLPPINAELFFSIYIIEIESLSSGEENDTSDMVSTSLSSKYYKCATFRGAFSSKTIFVHCSDGIDGGLRGNYLQIEDDYPQLEYFGLCEVDLFVERNHYECGQVEVPAYGFVLDNQITNDGNRSVEYHCHEGYRLIGNSMRQCNTKTGQWVDQEPYCERITCSEPIPIHNGYHRVYGDYYDLPVVGTRTVYECRPGFVFVDTTNDTRICDNDGQWTGEIPRCEPIDCGHPESLLLNSEEFFLSGAQFRLINGTTKFSAITELVCSSQDILRGNLSRTSLWFRCREDGIWTEFAIGSQEKLNTSKPSTSSSNSCVKQRHNGFLYFYAYGSRNFFRKNFYIRETSVNILHLLAAVVIVAFLSIFIIVILLFKRNIIEWPTNMEYCSSSAKRIKSTGQSIVKFIIWIFALVKSYLQSLKCHCCLKCISLSNGQENDDQRSSRSVPFIITPSVSDVESARSSNQQQSSNSSTIEGDDKKDKKDDFNTALATFYEEITNAAKQMFSEETDRKLLRAARIAAELDAIKNQPDQTANYQWIYSTPPRLATSTSLPPSLHEYRQMPSNSQIYAKVDLIRKHRYRKEKEISIYQVPKPRCLEIDCLLDNHSSSTNGKMNVSTNYHQLRKAISTPDAVFVDAEGEYATIRRLMPYNQTANHMVQVISKISNHNQNSPPHIHEPINKYPLKTLL